jgi:hypothetical protein
MAEVDPARAPIFVVGTGRSGTTLLRNMLCAHPRIYVAFETMYYFYEGLYRRRRPRPEFLEYYFHTVYFRWLGVDPAPILASLPDPSTPGWSGLAFAAILRAKAAQYGRVRFGDKTPLHAGKLGRIFADFPDARVIHIVRDPRGTAHSLSRMPWASASLMVNANYMRTEHRQVAKFRNRILGVKLEDLLAEPRATMARILEFCGEPWDDAVLDHAHNLPAKDDVPPYPWLSSAATERVASAPPWSKLTPVETRMVEFIARDVMHAHGYAPAPLEREPSRLAVHWAGIREIPAYLRLLAIWAPTLWRARRVENIDDCWQGFLRRMNPGAWSQYPGFELPPIPPIVGRALPAAK